MATLDQIYEPVTVKDGDDIGSNRSSNRPLLELAQDADEPPHGAEGLRDDRGGRRARRHAHQQVRARRRAVPRRSASSRSSR